jgi:hypothetical protein
MAAVVEKFLVITLALKESENPPNASSTLLGEVFRVDYGLISCGQLVDLYSFNSA